MGFLSSTDVIECSATDLVGTHVGQTGPKTRQLFEKALGRVLFIDEAYRLTDGLFAKEAIDEVVGILTSQEFSCKLIVILAGYDQDMNKLLAVNSGLSSRFPDEINFGNLPPIQCLDILRKELGKMDIHAPVLNNSSPVEHETIVRLLTALSLLPSWGNARDIKTLAKQIIRDVIKNHKSTGAVGEDSRMIMSGKDAIRNLEMMLKERSDRATNIPRASKNSSLGFNYMQQTEANYRSLAQPIISIDHATRGIIHRS